jgi:serine/threonine-protein kinase RsbT
LTDDLPGAMALLNEGDIVKCRQAVRTLTRRLRFTLIDQTKLITAASELSRNALVYGGGGEMRWEIVSAGVRSGVRLVFEDKGPGIPDLELALTDGYTSGSGMGVGLSGSRRLVNEFHLHSVVGEGTRVTVTRWKST